MRTREGQFSDARPIKRTTTEKRKLVTELEEAMRSMRNPSKETITTMRERRAALVEEIREDEARTAVVDSRRAERDAERVQAAARRVRRSAEDVFTPRPATGS